MAHLRLVRCHADTRARCFPDHESFANHESWSCERGRRESSLRSDGGTEGAFSCGSIFGFPDHLPRRPGIRCFEHDEQPNPVASLLLLSRLKPPWRPAPIVPLRPLRSWSMRMLARRIFTKLLF